MLKTEKNMRRNHEQCDRKALGASRQTQLAIIHASKKVQTLPIYDLRTSVSVIYIERALSKIPRKFPGNSKKRIIVQKLLLYVTKIK